MKRSMLAALAAASIAAVPLCSTVPSAHAATQTTANAASAVTASTDATDVSTLRKKFNAYVAGLDVDATTRATLEAAGSSDHAFTTAAHKAVLTLHSVLTAAGVDRDAMPALDPDDYDCSPTALNRWASDQVAQIDPAAWDWYSNGLLGASPSLLVQYWTLMKTPQAPHDTSFGPDGSKTNAISRSFRAMQRFWDIDGSKIGLVSYDAKVLGDGEQAAANRQFVYDGLSQVSPLAAFLLQLSVEGGIAIGYLDGFPGGVDNPMFSVNSFAIDPTHATGDDREMLETLGITRRVAMGQGLVQLWQDIGLGRVGTRAVLAHEYAHQVQYSDNLFETDITDPAEATRRTELMADAFGTYFMVSKRGASLNKASTLQDLKTFYTVGDCSFSNPGHHGTPNQRSASAKWGADLVKAADNQGHILPSMTVATKFEKALPGIVAPDAS